MLLEGSCHCGEVKFKLESKHPYPFNRCYCSICRKTAGSGGFAVNISGDANTLEILQGEASISVYQAQVKDKESGEVSTSSCQRRFCKVCASNLWIWDPRWPELLHPFASAIDTPLAIPPERTHLMLGSAAGWEEPDISGKDKTFDEYPDESIADWHLRNGVEK
jgi:hypothetical protein